MTADAVGGVWTWALDLARALAEDGARCHLALAGPPPSPDQRAEIAAVPGLVLEDCDLPLDWTCDGPGPVLAAGGRLAELVRRLVPDALILAQPTLAAAGPLPCPTLAVAHGCIGTWWTAVRAGQPLPERYRWLHELNGRGLRAADRVVAPTRAHAEAITREYGLQRPAAHVHNGRAPLPLPPATGAAPFALTVGRLWDQAKNLPVLDAAAARLSVPFLALGPLIGENGERLMVRHLEAEGRATPARLAALLAEHPVFASSARFEPFGLAVLEAAQAGCPLVLSDVGSFRELWEDAATFLHADDADGFAREIGRLLADPDARAATGAAAAGRAGRYTPEKMARGYRDLLSEVTMEAEVA